MRGIVSCLKASDIVIGIEVIELVDEQTVQLLRIKATIDDNSLLYITELHTPDFQKYSYHWQREDGTVGIRWDNAPHYKELKTFPHHRHEGAAVFPSHRITIEEVIAEIENRLSGR